MAGYRPISQWWDFHAPGFMISFRGNLIVGIGKNLFSTWDGHFEYFHAVEFRGDYIVPSSHQSRPQCPQALWLAVGHLDNLWDDVIFYLVGFKSATVCELY